MAVFFLPPICPYLCSSTLPLISQANCLTHLSALWCRREWGRRCALLKERGNATRRKRDDPLFHVGTKFSFHWSAHNDFEETAWKVLKNTEMHILKSKDYLSLDARRVPKHAQIYPYDTLAFSFCMLLTYWFDFVIFYFLVFLLADIYLMFDVNEFQSSWLAV